MKAVVVSDIRAVFNAPERHEADALLGKAVVMEVSQDWQTGKRYIKWEPDQQ